MGEAALIGEAALQRTELSSKNCEWSNGGEMLEYTANANPPMSEVPVRIFPAALHQAGETQITPLDLSEALSLNYKATAPNLLAR